MSTVPELEKQIKALAPEEFEELMRRIRDHQTEEPDYPPTKLVYKNGFPVLTGGKPITQEMIDEAIYGLP